MAAACIRQRMRDAYVQSCVQHTSSLLAAASRRLHARERAAICVLILLYLPPAGGRHATRFTSC
jgi:hypothetical protein